MPYSYADYIHGCAVIAYQSFGSDKKKTSQKTCLFLRKSSKKVRKQGKEKRKGA